MAISDQERERRKALYATDPAYRAKVDSLRKAKGLARPVPTTTPRPVPPQINTPFPLSEEESRAVQTPQRVFNAEMFGRPLNISDPTGRALAVAAFTALDELTLGKSKELGLPYVTPEMAEEYPTAVGAGQVAGTLPSFMTAGGIVKLGTRILARAAGRKAAKAAIKEGVTDVAELATRHAGASTALTHRMAKTGLETASTFGLQAAGTEAARQAIGTSQGKPSDILKQGALSFFTGEVLGLTGSAVRRLPHYRKLADAMGEYEKARLIAGTTVKKGTPVQLTRGKVQMPGKLMRAKAAHGALEGLAEGAAFVGAGFVTDKIQGIDTPSHEVIFRFALPLAMRSIGGARRTYTEIKNRLGRAPTMDEVLGDPTMRAEMRKGFEKNEGNIVDKTAEAVKEAAKPFDITRDVTTMTDPEQIRTDIKAIIGQPKQTRGLVVRRQALERRLQELLANPELQKAPTKPAKEKVTPEPDTGRVKLKTGHEVGVGDVVFLDAWEKEVPGSRGQTKIEKGGNRYGILLSSKTRQNREKTKEYYDVAEFDPAHPDNIKITGVQHKRLTGVDGDVPDTNFSAFRDKVYKTRKISQTAPAVAASTAAVESTATVAAGTKAGTKAKWERFDDFESADLAEQKLAEIRDAYPDYEWAIKQNMRTKKFVLAKRHLPETKTVSATAAPPSTEGQTPGSEPSPSVTHAMYSSKRETLENRIPGFEKEHPERAYSIVDPHGEETRYQLVWTKKEVAKTEKKPSKTRVEIEPTPEEAEEDKIVFTEEMIPTDRRTVRTGNVVVVADPDGTFTVHEIGKGAPDKITGTEIAAGSSGITSKQVKDLLNSRIKEGNKPKLKTPEKEKEVEQEEPTEEERDVSELADHIETEIYKEDIAGMDANEFLSRLEEEGFGKIDSREKAIEVMDGLDRLKDEWKEEINDADPEDRPDLREEMRSFSDTYKEVKAQLKPLLSGKVPEKPKPAAAKPAPTPAKTEGKKPESKPEPKPEPKAPVETTVREEKWVDHKGYGKLQSKEAEDRLLRIFRDKNDGKQYRIHDHRLQVLEVTGRPRKVETKIESKTPEPESGLVTNPDIAEKDRQRIELRSDFVESKQKELANAEALLEKHPSGRKREQLLSLIKVLEADINKAQAEIKKLNGGKLPVGRPRKTEAKLGPTSREIKQKKVVVKMKVEVEGGEKPSTKPIRLTAAQAKATRQYLDQAEVTGPINEVLELWRNSPEHKALEPRAKQLREDLFQKTVAWLRATKRGSVADKIEADGEDAVALYTEQRDNFLRTNGEGAKEARLAGKKLNMDLAKARKEWLEDMLADAAAAREEKSTRATTPRTPSQAPEGSRLPEHLRGKVDFMAANSPWNPDFSNTNAPDMNHALFQIGYGKAKHQKHGEYLAYLQKVTGMPEADLVTLGREYQKAMSEQAKRVREIEDNQGLKHEKQLPALESGIETRVIQNDVAKSAKKSKKTPLTDGEMMVSLLGFSPKSAITLAKLTWEGLSKLPVALYHASFKLPSELVRFVGAPLVRMRKLTLPSRQVEIDRLRKEIARIEEEGTEEEVDTLEGLQQKVDILDAELHAGENAMRLLADIQTYWHKVVGPAYILREKAISKLSADERLWISDIGDKWKPDLDPALLTERMIDTYGWDPDNLPTRLDQIQGRIAFLVEHPEFDIAPTPAIKGYVEMMRQVFDHFDKENLEAGFIVKDKNEAGQDIKREYQTRTNYFSHVLTRKALQAIKDIDNPEASEESREIAAALLEHGIKVNLGKDFLQRLPQMLNHVMGHKGERHFGPQDYARLVDLPFFIRTKGGKVIPILEANPERTLEIYMHRAATRIAVHKYAAPEGFESANKFEYFAQLFAETNNERAVMDWRKLTDLVQGYRIEEYDPESLATRVWKNIDNVSRALQLSTSAIGNIPSYLTVAARYGVKNSAEAFLKTFQGEGKPGKTELDELQMMGAWMKDITSFYYMTDDISASQLTGKFAKGTMQAVGSNAINRNITKVAQLAAIHSTKDAIRRLILEQGNPRGVQTLRERLKRDFVWNDADLDRIMSQGLSELDTLRVAVRGGALTNVVGEFAFDRPLWLNKRLGKAIFAYQAYARAVGRTMADAFWEAYQNVKNADGSTRYWGGMGKLLGTTMLLAGAGAWYSEQKDLLNDRALVFGAIQDWFDNHDENEKKVLASKFYLWTLNSGMFGLWGDALTSLFYGGRYGMDPLSTFIMPPQASAAYQLLAGLGASAYYEDWYDAWWSFRRSTPLVNLIANNIRRSEFGTSDSKLQAARKLVNSHMLYLSAGEGVEGPHGYLEPVKDYRYATTKKLLAATSIYHIEAAIAERRMRLKRRQQVRRFKGALGYKDYPY